MKRYFLLIAVVVITISFFALRARSDTDLHILAAEADKFMIADSKITLKLRSSYSRFQSKEQFLSISKEISAKLGLPINGETIDNHVPVYRSQQSKMGQTLSLIVSGVDGDDSSYVVITIESSSLRDVQALQSLQRQVGQQCRDLGINSGWNINIQGIVRNTFGDSQQVWGQLKEDLHAALIDQYEDSGTRSVSFDTPGIMAAVSSGSKRINLQAAIHKLTDTGQLRLTLGSPVITSEY